MYEGKGDDMRVIPIETQYSDFQDYIEECIKNGFTVKYEKDKLPLLKNQVEIISGEFELEKEKK